MDLKTQLPKLAVVGVMIAAAVIVVGKMQGADDKTATLDVQVPKLSALAAQGEKLFEANCMVCHGKNAGGSEQGPPLIHKIYEPNHHGDQSFILAAKRGVRAHHWPFGNMPAQPQVSESDAWMIVGYVRELQKANGIY